MSEAKHTPGPWTVQLTGRRGSFHIPEAQRHEAEHTEDGQDGFSVSSSNAALIAAAPDMLAALKVFADELDCLEAQGVKPPPERMLMFASEGGGTFLGIQVGTLYAARAAVAKATAVNRARALA